MSDSTIDDLIRSKVGRRGGFRSWATTGRVEDAIEQRVEDAAEDRPGNKPAPLRGGGAAGVSEGVPFDSWIRDLARGR